MKVRPYIVTMLPLILWFLVTEFGNISSYVLPGQKKVLFGFIKMVWSGELFVDIAISFGRVLKGFLIAFMLAFILGIFRIAIPKATRYYEYILHFSEMYHLLA